MNVPSPIDSPSADPVNIEQILVTVTRLARRFARRLVRREDVDDIAQETVLECLIKLRNGYWVPEESALPVFVRHMVWRRSVDRLRRAQRRDVREREHHREVQESVHAWMSPSLAQESRELDALHEQAVAELPEACRRAYVMVRDEDLSYDVVATRLGVTRRAVAGHVVRAQQRLTRSLRAHGVSTPRRARNGALCGEPVLERSALRRGV